MESREGYRKPRSVAIRIPVRDLEAENHDPLARNSMPADDDAAPVLPAETATEGSGQVSGMAEERSADTASNGVQSCGAISLSEAAEIAALRARVVELEDRWKRAAAELDNYRKRFDREFERQRQVERETIFRAWLTVVDDMERALCSQGASSSPWYEGMDAIYGRMLSVLAQFGVQPFVPQGEMFDPARHDAVATANLPEEPEGKIIEVVETGYLLDGRVLRPAKVIAVKHRDFLTG